MSVAGDEARAIVTDWLGMFDPPPQIDFQQSELLQQAIAAALMSATKPWPQEAIDQEMIERTDDGWKADRE